MTKFLAILSLLVGCVPLSSGAFSNEGNNMNDSKPCIAILEGTFNVDGQKTPEFKEYSKRSNANGEANGGTLLGKYFISDNLGEGTMPHVVFVVQYPSCEVARSTFSNDEYRAILPLRNIAFKEVKILISEKYENE